jgi:hypothetical protein
MLLHSSPRAIPGSNEGSTDRYCDLARLIYLISDMTIRDESLLKPSIILALKLREIIRAAVSELPMLIGQVGQEID